MILGKKLRNLLRERVWLCCPGFPTGTHRLKCWCCLSLPGSWSTGGHLCTWLWCPNFVLHHFIRIAFILVLFYFKQVSLWHLFVCVCSRVCVFLCGRVYVHECVQACWCLPRLLSTLFLETESLAEVRAPWFVSPDRPPSPEVPSVQSQCWGYRCTRPHPLFL